MSATHSNGTPNGNGHANGHANGVANGTANGPAADENRIIAIVTGANR